MIWNNILKITFGTKIVYEKSSYKKEVHTKHTKSKFKATNTINYTNLKSLKLG